jgi:hypothetical protein
MKKGSFAGFPFMHFGAGEESRTLDLNLGKVALYQLSYSRVKQKRNYKPKPDFVNKFTLFVFKRQSDREL